MSRAVTSKTPLVGEVARRRQEAVIAKERTLARIANSIGSSDKCLTWGAVIDCTEPVKAKGDTLMVKMKIIDPSLNYKQTQAGINIRFLNYAILYIYGDDAEGLPSVETLGEIIRIRRFAWTVSQHGELVGSCRIFSNWYTFGVTENTNRIISKMQIQNNLDRQLEDHEVARLKELRKWVRAFFGENSIRQVSWWSPVKIPSHHHGNSPQEFQGVDLILLVKKVEKGGRSLRFADQAGVGFSMDPDFEATLEVGDIIKLKGAKVIVTPHGRSLHLTSKSSMLKVPPIYLDAKGFDSAYYDANRDRFEVKPPVFRSKRFQGGFPTKEAVLAVYPYLRDYYFEDHLINKPEIGSRAATREIVSEVPTIVHKNFFNKIPLKLSYLSDAKNQMIKKLVYEKFALLAQVVGWSPRKSADMLKLHCEKCTENKRMGQKGGLVCCGQRMQLCIFAKLDLRDDSMPPDSTFPVYVLAKSQDRNIFALWGCLPDLGEPDCWGEPGDEAASTFSAKMDRLVEAGVYLNICVQGKETGKGKRFLEVCDTFFLP